MPTTDALHARLLALFEAGDEAPCSLQQLPNPSDIPAQGIVVRLDFAGQGPQPDAAARLDTWLDAPNPAFGGRAPRCFLEGDTLELNHLAAVVGALEQGFFS